MDNRFFLMGRLAKVGELQNSVNNKKYCYFTVVKNNFKKESVYFDCVAWGHIGEVISELKKGTCVTVSGWLDIYYRNIDVDGDSNSRKFKQLTLNVDNFSYCPVNREKEIIYDPDNREEFEEVPF